MKTPLPADIGQIVYDRAHRLLTVRDAVADVFGGSKREVAAPTDLRDFVFAFGDALSAIRGSYGVIVGGLAVQEHGYVRWTEDVDVVVSALHHDEIIKRLHLMGFTSGTDSLLRRGNSRAALDIACEASVLKASLAEVPSPRDLGPNGGFATLAGTIHMKLLSSGRMRHVADIVELLKRQFHQAASIESALPEMLRNKYRECMQQARDEMQS